jgi:hypothetical protein
MATCGRTELDQATQLLWEEGVCVLEGILDPAVVSACHEHLSENDPGLLEQNEDPRKYYVTDGRYYAGVAVEGPFAQRDMILPSEVEKVVSATLASDFIIDSLGFIVAHPGAPEQHWHRDGGVLFPGHPLEFMLPATAITLVIPLVEMNAETGTTGFLLKSHRNRDPVDRPDYEPVVEVGSAILWDYRINHKGMANRSRMNRPLITATLCRPWWMDELNFDDADKLVIRRDVLEELEPDLQKRLVRARVVD